MISNIQKVLVLFLIFPFVNSQTSREDTLPVASSSSFSLQTESSSNINTKAELQTQSASSSSQCQTITVPMCLNMPYNSTSMPNQFNHYTQQEAAMEAHQFWALVEINCSPDLRFFLCSMYTPICITPSYAKPLRACRSVCVRARLGCEKYMRKFGFDWPEHMNCDLFPEYGSVAAGDICMDPQDAQVQQSAGNKELIVNHQVAASTSSPTTVQTDDDDDDHHHHHEVNSKSPLTATTTRKSIQLFEQLSDVLCRDPFAKPTDDSGQSNSAGYLPNCKQQARCDYFTKWQQWFTYYWLMVWTILCLTSSLCTTLSYLIETSRFRYPERPIIYLSICYLFVSLGYLVRYIFGQNQNSVRMSFPCSLTFVLIYYFGMASSIWWVIVSLTWFLAAGLKWSSESITKYVKYFHLAAWLVPFAKTCLILLMSLVDGDELTGICFVGNMNSNALRWFVIIPSFVYLMLGVAFLGAGLVSLERIRGIIVSRRDGAADLKKTTHKLETLMIRIGIYAILYTVPATCVIVCQFYEQYYRSDWEKSLMCKNYFLSRHGSLAAMQQQKNYDDVVDDDVVVRKFCSSNNNDLSAAPDFLIFMLKYFMSLIVGVTSGFWIWTRKTIDAWKQFGNKYFSCKFSSFNQQDRNNPSSSCCQHFVSKNKSDKVSSSNPSNHQAPVQNTYDYGHHVDNFNSNKYQNVFQQKQHLLIESNTNEQREQNKSESSSIFSLKCDQKQQTNMPSSSSSSSSKDNIPKQSYLFAHNLHHHHHHPDQKDKNHYLNNNKTGFFYDSLSTEIYNNTRGEHFNGATSSSKFSLPSSTISSKL